MTKRIETGYKKQISTEEVETLINGVKSYRVKVILQVMRYTGLRVGDCCSLRKDEFDFKNGKIIKLMEKTKKIIEIPLNNRIKEILTAYFTTIKLKTENPFIFQSRIKPEENRHIKPNSVRWEIAKARRKTNLNESYYTNKNGQNLKRVSAHVLRHYFASQIYYKSNNNIVAVKNLLGHSKIETTIKHYIDDVNMEKKKELVELII